MPSLAVCRCLFRLMRHCFLGRWTCLPVSERFRLVWRCRLFANIFRNIIKHNIRTSKNERTHFFIKIYLSLFILERVDVGCVRDELEMGIDCYIDPAVLFSHLGWIAQPWVTEGPKPSVCRWLSLRYLVSNWPQQARTASGTWLYKCLTSTCFCCSSAYLHRCISWLTARSRVSRLHFLQ